MDELFSFLRARMDERRRSALEAGRSSGSRVWVADQGHVEDSEGGPVTHTDGSSPDGRARSHHIRENDPDHVLRDMESKRRNLEQYQLVRDGLVEHPEREAVLSEYQDVVLPLLARPFSRHPDHRQQWATHEDPRGTAREPGWGNDRGFVP